MIRPLTPEDAKALVELQWHLDQEAPWRSHNPGERQITQAEQARRLRGMRSNAIMLGQWDMGLIGYIGIWGGSEQRRRHLARLTIAVRQAYQGYGHAQALFTEGERWSKQVGIQRLEITVAADNPAVRWYQRQGFECEGTRYGALLVDGHLVDELYMGKMLFS